MPTEHEQDILDVMNVDVNCNDIDSEEGYSHSDYFQVRYNSKPYRIEPGKIKRMPRFLAEHFAKHLADHCLMKMEEQTGRKGLMQSPVERPKMLGKILVGVDTYFSPEDPKQESDKVSKQVDELNEERALDLGTVPPSALGILKDEPPSLDQLLKTAGEASKALDDTPKEPQQTETKSIFDPAKTKPTKRELIEECVKLGIEFKGNESYETLENKIKSF